MSRLHIPGIVDVLRVDTASAINEIADDVRFDRRYVARGPLLNRIILRHVRRVLALDGFPLPPVAERGPVRPLPSQLHTEAKLNAGITAGIKGPAVDALAAYVRGEGDKKRIGALAQQVVGHLFEPMYRADAQSWDAAKVLGQAPSSFNPVKRFYWWATGAIDNARSLLAGKVNNDPTGLHATGVAIHNLVDAFIKMRALYADETTRDHHSVEAAIAQCMVAPKQVLRQPVQAGLCAQGEFSANTLVLLRLQKANAADPGYDTSLMVGSWSQCPAHQWVPALLSAVWLGANERAA